MRWPRAWALAILASACSELEACRDARGPAAGSTGAPAPAALNPPTSSAPAARAARARGRILYLDHCALCHGERADGQGARTSLSMPAASFSDPVWVARATPRGVFEVLRSGVRGTPMPAWPALSDSDCWDLVAYVLSVHEEGP